MSLKTRKILFLVEGKKTEPNITTSLAKNILHLSEKDYEIVVYNTCIYELYDEIKDDRYIDIVGLLVEKGLINLEENQLVKNLFSQIYLFFDFEPHYQKFGQDKIKNMLDYFNDVDGNGKLYINYPMVESIFYLDDFYKPSTIGKKISLYDFNGNNFKKLVKSITCFKNKNNVNFNLNNLIHCYFAIKWNYLTYCKITNSNVNCYFDNIDYCLLLDKQIDVLNKSNSIYVIGTMVLLFVDYYPELLSKIENDLLINESCNK